MRGRHCAGLTGCNTKNHPTRNQSGKSAKWKRLSRTRQTQNFSRDMREKGRYDDNGRHLRRRHGGAEVGDGRISAARVSAGSRGEARFIPPLLEASHDGGSEGVPQLCYIQGVRVYLPRLPGSTPDLRGDPPRDFRSRFVTSSELREIRLRFEAGSHGSKHQLWNPPLERGPSLPTSCPRRKPCFEASHDVRVKPNERVERTNQDE